MSQMVRPCPDCGDERLFEQLHDAAGSCPDVPGGICPEWLCTGCGAAFITGLPPAQPEPALAASLPGKVA